MAESAVHTDLTMESERSGCNDTISEGLNLGPAIMSASSPGSSPAEPAAPPTPASASSGSYPATADAPSPADPPHQTYSPAEQLPRPWPSPRPSCPHALPVAPSSAAP